MQVVLTPLVVAEGPYPLAQAHWKPVPGAGTSMHNPLPAQVTSTAVLRQPLVSLHEAASTAFPVYVTVPDMPDPHVHAPAVPVVGTVHAIPTQALPLPAEAHFPVWQAVQPVKE